MPYLPPLTFPQAALLGGTGIVCLSIGYGLSHVIQRIDNYARKNIEINRYRYTENPQMAASKLNIYFKWVSEGAYNITMLGLACLAFLLWCMGTAFVTFAAIGPLMV